MRYGLRSASGPVIPPDVSLGVVMRPSAPPQSETAAETPAAAPHFAGWSWAAVPVRVVDGAFVLAGVAQYGHSFAEGSGDVVGLPLDGEPDFDGYWITAQAVLEGATYPSTGDPGNDVFIGFTADPVDLYGQGVGYALGPSHATQFSSAFYVRDTDYSPLQNGDWIELSADGSWPLRFNFTTEGA